MPSIGELTQHMPGWSKALALLAVVLAALYLWNPSKGHQTPLSAEAVQAAEAAKPVKPAKDGQLPEVLKHAADVCRVARNETSMVDCQISRESEWVDVTGSIYTEDALPMCNKIANALRVRTSAFEHTGWKLRVYDVGSRSYPLAECPLPSQ